MTIDNDIQKILGVVPELPVPVPRKAIKWTDFVSERPNPRYLYTVSVYKSLYASVTFEAYDKPDAREMAWSHIDWDWEDGDFDIADVNQDDNLPVNQAEIDSWDEQYGNQYDMDGRPMCSECGNAAYAADELTSVGEKRWLCSSCLGPQPF